MRLDLIDGRLDAALKDSVSRLARYDTDYTRRDVMGLRFMSGQSDDPWRVFMERAATSDVVQLWVGASVGHRLQRSTLDQIRAWLIAKQFQKTQISFVDVSSLFLHMMAVTDRAPSEADIALLRELPGPSGPRDPRWAMSAVVASGAMTRSDPKVLLARFSSLAAELHGEPAPDSQLALYTWMAAQAGAPVDETLEQVRAVSRSANFDHLLAKSMLLAATGQIQDSLSFLQAARFELGYLTWGENGLSAREVTPEYQYALAVYLMWRKTNDDAFRTAALQFARERQRISPYIAWTYGLEAATEQSPSKQILAACRATFLDSGSFFLGQAQVVLSAKGRAACPRKLW